jgi:hypothetical protein
LGTTVVDSSSGEVKQPDAAQVSRAIRTAVDYGFLHRDSCARCLVVPPYGIEGGMIGSPKEPCTLHADRPRALHSDTKKPGFVVPQRQGALHSETTRSVLTCTDIDSLYISSNPHLEDQLNPLVNTLARRAAS